MKRANIFKIAAAVILGLTAAIWLIKGIVDLIGGTQGGILNLIFSIALFGLTFLSWKRPLVGGVITASVGVLLIVGFNLVLPDIYAMAVSFFQMFLPMAIAGLLFIEADWAKKKRN